MPGMSVRSSWPRAPDGKDILVRVGRFGPYIEHNERRASIPEGLAPDELSVEKAIELLDKAEKGEEPLGACPDTGKPIFVKVGRFGPYVQRGTTDDSEPPQNASLLKDMSPEEVDLETALRLLALPRVVGVNPDNDEPIEACNGRYGPYVKCGSETRSLTEGLSPLDINLQQSLELLKQPKRGRRAAAAKKEPIKVFGDSPVTESPVQLLEGRYGPYVTDGVTNASIPKDLKPEEVSFERALDLLAERAAKAPRKKKAAKKKTTKKKAAKKKTTKKKNRQEGNDQKEGRDKKSNGKKASQE